MNLAARLAFLDDDEPPDLPDRLPAAAPVETLDAELEDLTGLALKKMREILSEPTDFSEPKALNIQLSAAQSVLTAQVRVDEGRLKKRKLDILPKLLEIMDREEGKMAAASLLIEG